MLYPVSVLSVLSVEPALVQSQASHNTRGMGGREREREKEREERNGAFNQHTLKHTLKALNQAVEVAVCPDSFL